MLLIIYYTSQFSDCLYHFVTLSLPPPSTKKSIQPEFLLGTTPGNIYDKLAKIRTIHKGQHNLPKHHKEKKTGLTNKKRKIIKEHSSKRHEREKKCCTLSVMRSGRKWYPYFSPTLLFFEPWPKYPPNSKGYLLSRPTGARLRWIRQILAPHSPPSAMM